MRNNVVYAGAAGGSAFTANWEERLKHWEVRIPVGESVKREQLAGILSAQDRIRPAESLKKWLRFKLVAPRIRSEQAQVSWERKNKVSLFLYFFRV